MVEPRDVPRILSDAARLVREGEVVVFGSAALPDDWRTRARTITSELWPEVRVVVPHPHDVMLSKLYRLDPQDRTHICLILDELPLGHEQLDKLVSQLPPRGEDDSARLEHGLAWLRGQLAPRG